MAQVTTIQANVGILPDSPLYGLKTFGERVQLALTLNLVDKVNLKYKLSEKRLAEAQQMIKQGKTQEAKKALVGYNRLNRELKADKTKLRIQKKYSATLDKADKKIANRRISVLKGMIAKSSDNTRQAIMKTVSKSVISTKGAVARKK